jgi:hypothetical protein
MGRVIIRVEMNQSDVEALDKIGDRRGMTQLSIVSRMVSWFARQDADIQRLILNDRADPVGAASTILKRLAKRGNPKNRGS